MPSLTTSEGMSVLKLATMWKFDSIRASMITAMTSGVAEDPILQLIAAVKYDVSGWLVPAVNALARCAEPLTVKDVDRLSDLEDSRRIMKLVLDIYAVRERFKGSNEARKLYDFTPHTVEVFGLDKVDSMDHTMAASSFVIQSNSRLPQSVLIHAGPGLSLDESSVAGSKRKQSMENDTQRKRTKNAGDQQAIEEVQPSESGSETQGKHYIVSSSRPSSILLMPHFQKIRWTSFSRLLWQLSKPQRARWPRFKIGSSGPSLPPMWAIYTRYLLSVV
jgi:hypothetical protein